MSSRPRVLFLCTGNSCRSQIAEGWARALKSEALEAYSAGTETHGLNPHAVRVMNEVGVDISEHRSKTLADLDVEFDLVVTVCSDADRACPAFPGSTRLVHVGFDDPPRLARQLEQRGEVDEESALEPYRRVRDEIRSFVESLPGEYL